MSVSVAALPRALPRDQFAQCRIWNEDRPLVALPGRPLSGEHDERKIAFGINVIWAVQSRLQRYFRSRLTQITSRTSDVSFPLEGRFAIVTDVGNGMRWTQAALLTRARTCGRRSRVVLTPRRRRQVSRRQLLEMTVTKKP